MYRYAIEKLKEWKTSRNRKPLILRGARQTGKTWLMKEFGQSCYTSCAYINFQNNSRMKRLFQEDFNTKRLLTGLQLEADCVIQPESTLLLFDEVQEVPEALTSLKYFNEQAPEYHILAAGSMLGVAMHSNSSFPVGKVDFLDLFPMSFSEFMMATENDNLVQLLYDEDYEMVTVFSARFTDLLRSYLFVGGMPEAVLRYREQNDYHAARAIQKALLAGYEQDFSKHSPTRTVPRIRSVWNSLPAQLARENRRFIWGLVRNGARAREYETAIQWLLDCGLVAKVSRVTRPGIPPAAYRDTAGFKLFVLDTGLLGAMCSIDPATILEGNKLFTEFKGALTEQFVLQQLLANNMEPFYWSSDRGNAEVDFLVQHSGKIVPIEVKAAENLQAKSLKVYRKRFSPSVALRTSLSDFRIDDGLINLPLYAIENMLPVISSQG